MAKHPRERLLHVQSDGRVYVNTPVFMHISLYIKPSRKAAFLTRLHRRVQRFFR